MRVLGIDTATTVASVALVEDGRLLAAASSEDEAVRGEGQPGSGSHAKILIPLIDRILVQSKVSLSELTAIALSIGPGSFTGLRIGLSTVKGLTFSSHIPVVAIPTLYALAARVHSWEGLICPILDARKKEVYASVFCRRSQMLEQIGADAVEPAEKTIERIQACREGRACLLIGDGVHVYGAMMQRALGDAVVLSVGQEYASMATAVALLGAGKILRSGADALESLVPRYLRPSEAEMRQR